MVSKDWLIEHFWSAFKTFVPVFLVAVGEGLNSGTFHWTSAALGTLVITAARAAFKALWEPNVSPALGGTKQTYNV